MIAVSFNGLVGDTLLGIYHQADNGGSEECLYLETDKGWFAQLHTQDCCERVSLESVVGFTPAAHGEVIVTAEERESTGVTTADESFTWTFYEIATPSAAITIRWYGSSNGYYSESVSFGACAPPDLDNLTRITDDYSP